MGPSVFFLVPEVLYMDPYMALSRDSSYYLRSQRFKLHTPLKDIVARPFIHVMDCSIATHLHEIQILLLIKISLVGQQNCLYSQV